MKPSFEIHPVTESKQWVIEVYDNHGAFTGRVVVRDKSELLHALDEAIEEDLDIEVDLEEN